MYQSCKYKIRNIKLYFGAIDMPHNLKYETLRIYQTSDNTTLNYLILKLYFVWTIECHEKYCIKYIYSFQQNICGW